MSTSTMYHVHPETGDVGVCRAKTKPCPFLVFTEHFDTPEEAQVYSEKTQGEYAHFNWKSKMPASKKAITIAIYDPFSQDVPQGGVFGNPIYGAFAEKMDAAKKGTRLVVENGQVWEKDTESYWTFVSGDEDIFHVAMPGETLDRSRIGQMILTYGARMEKGGETPVMPAEFRTHIIPDERESKAEAKIVADAFRKTGAASEQDLEEHLYDYIAERWCDVEPKHYEHIANKLRAELKEPINYGTDEKPDWSWSR